MSHIKTLDYFSTLSIKKKPISQKSCLAPPSVAETTVTEAELVQGAEFSPAMSLPTARGWSSVFFEDPFNLSHSLILQISWETQHAEVFSDITIYYFMCIKREGTSVSRVASLLTFPGNKTTLRKAIQEA